MQNLDDPNTTVNRISIINKKPFLKNVYMDFYHEIKTNLKSIPKGKKIELGSGAGFIKDVIPDVVTTDIMELPNVDMEKINGEDLPFKNESLSAIIMLNVFHHFSDPNKALKEFERVLKKKGKVIMIEPWNTLWSRFIYKNFHHEAFDTKAKWKVKQSGPLSGGNDALPWIVFERDKDIFVRKFPQLKIDHIRSHTPFKYIASGGFSRPSLLPDSLYKVLNDFEQLIKSTNKYLGMFATIVIVKK